MLFRVKGPLKMQGEPLAWPRVQIQADTEKERRASTDRSAVVAP
jgi:hypothetical protein